MNNLTRFYNFQLKTMLRNELKNIKAGTKELRNFGIVVGGIFAVLGFLPYIFGSEVNPPLLFIGLFLILLGAFAARLLYWPYRAWMGFAVIMGWIMSRLILTMLFYVIITPIGILTRALGKDFLDLRRQARAGSYWSKRGEPPSKEQYERQF